MDYTIRIFIALIVLRFDGIFGFNGMPRKLPSPSAASPLRVASTAWATSNDGVGAFHCAYGHI